MVATLRSDELDTVGLGNLPTYLLQYLAGLFSGKAVAIAGISAGMILMSGCSSTTSSNQSNETLQISHLHFRNFLVIFI